MVERLPGNYRWPPGAQVGGTICDPSVRLQGGLWLSPAASGVRVESERSERFRRDGPRGDRSRRCTWDGGSIRVGGAKGPQYDDQV